MCYFVFSAVDFGERGAYVEPGKDTCFVSDNHRIHPPPKESGKAFEPRGGIMLALLELPLNTLDKAFAGHFVHMVEPNAPVRLLEVRL